jgi:hypothetical protein
MNRQRQAAILETTGSSGNRNVPVPVEQQEIAVISVSAGDFDGPNNTTLTPAPTQEETIEEEETDKPSESVDVHLKKITLRNDLKACTSGKQMRFLLSNYASSTNDGFYWSLLRPLLTENKLLNSDKGRCCCRNAYGSTLAFFLTSLLRGPCVVAAFSKMNDTVKGQFFAATDSLAGPLFIKIRAEMVERIAANIERKMRKVTKAGAKIAAEDVSATYCDQVAAIGHTLCLPAALDLLVAIGRSDYPEESAIEYLTFGRKQRAAHAYSSLADLLNTHKAEFINNLADEFPRLADIHPERCLQMDGAEFESVYENCRELAKAIEYNYQLSGNYLCGPKRDQEIYANFCNSGVAGFNAATCYFLLVTKDVDPRLRSAKLQDDECMESFSSTSDHRYSSPGKFAATSNSSFTSSSSSSASWSSFRRNDNDDKKKKNSSSSSSSSSSSGGSDGDASLIDLGSSSGRGRESTSSKSSSDRSSFSSTDSTGTSREDKETGSASGGGGSGAGKGSGRRSSSTKSSGRQKKAKVDSDVAAAERDQAVTKLFRLKQLKEKLATLTQQIEGSRFCHLSQAIQDHILAKHEATMLEVSEYE